MTSTIDQPRTAPAEPGVPMDHQNRALRIGLFVVAVIAVALGGILIYSATTDDRTATAIPDDVQQVVDDFVAANNNEDFEALLAVTTDAFTRPMYELHSDGGTRTSTWREVSTFDDIERNFGSSGSYEITNVGDALIHGDGPWIVSLAQVWESLAPDDQSGTGVGYKAVYTLVIVDDDGTVKIDDAYWAGYGFVSIED